MSAEATRPHPDNPPDNNRPVLRSLPDFEQPIDSVLTQRLIETVDAADPPIKTDEGMERAVLDFTLSSVQRATQDLIKQPVVNGDILRKKYEEYHVEFGRPIDSVAGQKRDEHIDHSVEHARQFTKSFPEIGLLDAVQQRLIMRRREREARAVEVVLAVYGQRFALMTGRRPEYRPYSPVTTEFPNLPAD